MEKQRIEAIDGYRGLLMFVMMSAHLVFLPFISFKGLYSFICNHAFNPFGILSLAEGFFFLSGLAAGIAYFNLDSPELNQKVRKRIKQMYVIHISTLFLLCLGFALSAKFYSVFETLHSLVPIWIDQEGIRFIMNHPWQGFGLGALFLYLPPFFDIIPVYIAYLLVMPVALQQVRQGRARYVLLLSIALWLITQILPINLLDLALSVPHMGWFNPFGLQLVFIVGLICGHYYRKGEPVWQLLLEGTLILALCFPLITFLDGDINSVHKLGVHRLFWFGVKVLLATLLAKKIILRPFVLLGRWPLQLFIFHQIFIYVSTLFLMPISALPTPLKVLLYVLCISTIWAYAMYLSRRRISHGKQKYA